GFELMPDTGIANSWPFDFRASVVFRLAGRSLTYEINVENVGKKDMPFAWGGHPGFALPFESEPLCDFEDYSIVFSEPCEPVAMEITPDGFVGEGRTPVALEDGVRLPLRRAYFAVDGLFMTGCARRLTLEGRGKTKIVMEYPDCPTLGLWTAAGGSAPFICIEPWSGTPDRASGPEPCLLEEKPDMTRLKPGENYRGSYKIEITGTD
ncbi:MAG: hypothetical protein J6V01_06145, partial [Clostridia bacterium]|nr:hypothetical protein [Clostridia bacterium]